MQLDAEHFINKVSEGRDGKEMMLKTSGSKTLACIVLREKKILNTYVKVLYGWEAFPARSSETFVGCPKGRHCQDIKDKHSGCKHGVLCRREQLNGNMPPFCNTEYKTNLNSIISVIIQLGGP